VIASRIPKRKWLILLHDFERDGITGGNWNPNLEIHICLPALKGEKKASKR